MVRIGCGMVVAATGAPSDSRKDRAASLCRWRYSCGASSLAQILSTVSGTIIEVLVAPGALVSVDEEVVLIESMKMEIPVAAEAQGTVREIRIGPGDLVVEGQVLIDLD